MAAVQKTIAATKQVVQHVNSGNLDKAPPLIKEIKLLLIQFGATRGTAARDEQAESEIAAAIGALEAFIVYTVKAKEDKEFGRYFAQLRSFYSMSSQPKPGQAKVLGLNLLRLLVDNRLAEFHSELELVPHDCVSSPFVKFPVSLEQSLMEGMYKKVLRARQTFPDPLFAEYLDALEDAVRDEISECSAASYSQLSLKAAQELFNFSSPDELRDYCEDREGWTVETDAIQFPEKRETTLGRNDIPSQRTISEVLSFAARLERIV